MKMQEFIHHINEIYKTTLRKKVTYHSEIDKESSQSLDNFKELILKLKESKTDGDDIGAVRPLIDFLRLRWKKIRNTQFSYDVSPHSVINAYCVILAGQLALWYPIEGLFGPDVYLKPEIRTMKQFCSELLNELQACRDEVVPSLPIDVYLDSRQSINMLETMLRREWEEDVDVDAGSLKPFMEFLSDRASYQQDSSVNTAANQCCRRLAEKIAGELRVDVAILLTPRQVMNVECEHLPGTLWSTVISRIHTKEDLVECMLLSGPNHYDDILEQVTLQHLIHLLKSGCQDIQQLLQNFSVSDQNDERKKKILLYCLVTVYMRDRNQYGGYASLTASALRLFSVAPDKKTKLNAAKEIGELLLRDNITLQGVSQELSNPTSEIRKKYNVELEDGKLSQIVKLITSVGNRPAFKQAV